MLFLTILRLPCSIISADDLGDGVDDGEVVDVDIPESLGLS